MHYPWWYVPDLTAPMLIAAVSVVHVLVSHYAVGGGLFLALETGYAYKTGDRDYLAYLKRHARFFILLTVVFGAITGVGIWWTIGLASPLATGLLIKTFVFGWAIEWVFFVVEIAAAFIFYYYWGRLPEKTHVTIGWIYAAAAWISLVLITGITAFMLHPGGWLQTKSFWSAFFNPQFLPQTVARTGGALLLSSLYVYLHASLFIKDRKLCDVIERRSTRPALLGAVLIAAGGAAWYAFLPESAAAVLASAAVLNVLVVLIFALTAVVFVLLYVGPYRNPGWMTPGFAGALLLFGLAAFTTGEYIREAVRKPYVVYNVVLGNQILPEEVDGLRETGYLEGGTWTRAFVAANYPGVMTAGKINEEKLLELDREDRIALGEVLFQYHCNDCHAAARGYSPVAPLIRGWTPEMIRDLVEHLNEGHFFMPPWAGTDEEAELVAEYLSSIAPPRPGGMITGLPPADRATPSRDATETE
jgi:cytochrome bd-type quinol oxidase subunit 1/mono/diheme cytochrome c family protein